MLYENKLQHSLLLLLLTWHFLLPLGICLIYPLVFSSCKMCRIWYSKIMYFSLLFFFFFSFIFCTHSPSNLIGIHQEPTLTHPVLGNEKHDAGVCSSGEHRLLRRCKTAGWQCQGIKARESFKMLENGEACGKGNNERKILTLLLDNIDNRE